MVGVATIKHTASEMLNSGAVKSAKDMGAAGVAKLPKDTFAYAGLGLAGGAAIGAGIGAYRDDSSTIGGAFGGAILGAAGGGLGAMSKGLWKGLGESEIKSVEHTAGAATATAAPHMSSAGRTASDIRRASSARAEGIKRRSIMPDNPYGNYAEDYINPDFGPGGMFGTGEYGSYVAPGRNPAEISKSMAKKKKNNKRR